MNWQHLRAFLWLHWRLRVNQLSRGGTANKIILAILAVKLVLVSISLFAFAFGIAFLLDEVPPTVLMFIWDGLVLMFLFVWAIGMLADLQRSEALALTKFLHLPVSLAGVFVLNYLSSLLSISLILFVPAMLGFSLGLTFARGPIMLLLLPAIAAFLLMVTALTYQFQGWLASLMVDKRRRRTIIVTVTFFFILIFQVPNLINFFRPWETAIEEVKDSAKELQELDRALKAKEITPEQFGQRVRESQQRRQDDRAQIWQQVQYTGWIANVALPIGWMPLAAMGLAEGSVLWAILGTLGLGLIGTVSLWRAYRTTVRLYTGQFTKGAKPATPTAVAAPTAAPGVQSAGMVAGQLPWLSEQASVVALTCLRSLLRAPEAKMLFITPIIFVIIFGGMFWRTTWDMPAVSRPLLAFAGISMTLLTLVQLVGNQFGFDRSGFRVYVLSPAPRRDILIGKNLAALPVAFVLSLPLILVIQVLHPMRFDHLLAVAPLFLSMYLLYCLVANLISIFAPIEMAAGTMKPVKTKFGPIFIGMFFMSFFPLVLAPTLLPLGIEFGLESLGWGYGLPICFVLTLAECAAVIWIYGRIVTWQGGLLQWREQRILEVVTTKAE